MIGHFQDFRFVRVLIPVFLAATALLATAGTPPREQAVPVRPSGLTPISTPPSSTGPQFPSPQDARSAGQNEPMASLKNKQKRELMKANYEKMKRDADELAALAKSLQEEIDKSNENVLSLHIVDKAEKIEKLAKHIKGVAKGY